MGLLLSIETTTHSFSCALHNEGKLIAFDKSILKQSTASLLAVMIENLFEKSQLKKESLKGVAVASGPGSYTGLRIGVATAKGVCYALDIPMVSANSLLLMTQQAKKKIAQFEQGFFCPMLDARRMEVYCALFDPSLNLVSSIEAKVIDEKSFSDELKNKIIYFFGEGSEKCKDIISHSNAKFVSEISPDAKELGELAGQKFLKAEFEDIQMFEPFYLKDFIVKKPKSVF